MHTCGNLQSQKERKQNAVRYICLPDFVFASVINWVSMKQMKRSPSLWESRLFYRVSFIKPRHGMYFEIPHADICWKSSIKQSVYKSLSNTPGEKCLHIHHTLFRSYSVFICKAIVPMAVHVCNSMSQKV